MTKINEKVQKSTYLSLFETHLKRIKPYVTKDEILEKMHNKQCIFTNLLSHFKGDSDFREARQYCKQHLKDRDLIHSMVMLVEQTL